MCSHSFSEVFAGRSIWLFAISIYFSSRSFYSGLDSLFTHCPTLFILTSSFLTQPLSFSLYFSFEPFLFFRFLFVSFLFFIILFLIIVSFFKPFRWAVAAWCAHIPFQCYQQRLFCSCTFMCYMNRHTSMCTPVQFFVRIAIHTDARFREMMLQSMNVGLHFYFYLIKMENRKWTQLVHRDGRKHFKTAHHCFPANAISSKTNPCLHWCYKINEENIQR